MSVLVFWNQIQLVNFCDNSKSQLIIAYAEDTAVMYYTIIKYNATEMTVHRTFQFLNL